MAGPRAGFWGGSADLAPSNMTLMKAFGDFQKNQYQERNLRFGVREHGMGAICNGIALHNPGLIPYCATFFIFTGARRSPCLSARGTHSRCAHARPASGAGRCAALGCWPCSRAHVPRHACMRRLHKRPHLESLPSCACDSTERLRHMLCDG